MAHGPNYRVEFRRKREGVTDYVSRKKLISSGLPRFVVRKSLNAISCSVIEYSEEGDKTIISVTSLALPKLGYKGHTGNISAAYLTGYICGLKAKHKNINKAVLDIGLYKSVYGSNIYSALKGFIDAGIEVPHNPKISPPEERIKGEHIVEYAKKLKVENPEKYKLQFSKLLSRNFKPEDYVKHFEEIKKKISEEF